MKITEHFTWEEFSRSETVERYHIDNTIPEGVKPRIQVLCEQVLEPLRAHFGPIKVTSGYRCAALNAAIKGAKNSQHTKGEACDLTPASPKERSLKMIFLWMMDNLEFDQLILEPGWIHVSYREGRNRQQVITRART